jgi:multimeric flavodoxin WrbA
MRVLIINGARRNNGYTAEFTRLFSAGVTESGGIVEQVDLCDFDISPCQGCYSCWNLKHPGQCILEDDMKDIIERYLAADSVVFTTPLYFYSFCAGLKVFFERLLPLTEPTLKQGHTPDHFCNKMRQLDHSPKRTVLIAVGGQRSPKIMDGISTTFDLIAEGLDLEVAGKLLRCESFFFDFLPDKPNVRRQLCDAFQTAGKELVTLGKISQQTIDRAEITLCDNHSLYRDHFSTYWKIASETDGFVKDRELVKQAILDNLRVLMPEIAQCYDSSVEKDLEAVFQFEFSGQQPGPWQLAISKGKCQASAKRHSSPNVTIHVKSELFFDIVRLRENIRRLLANGQFKIEGDRRLFSLFMRLFRPPAH